MILRNDTVPCCYFSNVPFDFKVVDFKKTLCRSVDFKGQGPPKWEKEGPLWE